MSAITVTHGLRRKWDPIVIEVADFVQEQATCWGRSDWNVFEILQHGTPVIPYFDYDQELTEQPHLVTIRDTCLESIATIFRADSAFDLHADVKVGYRHGWLPSGKFKVSFRFWVRNYAVLIEDLPAIIKASSAKVDMWDLSVYSAKRKMGVPGSCKGEGDHRVLELEDRDHPELCIIQYLDGTEKTLQPTTQSIPVTVVSYPDVSPSEHHSSHTADLSSAITRRSGKPQDWERIRPVLVANGFHDPYPVGGRSKSITFRSADIGDQCPLCPHTHDRQAYWVMEQSDGRLLVKNYSSRCNQTVMGEPKYLFGEDAIEEMRVIKDQAQNLADTIGTFFTKATGTSVDPSSVQKTTYGFDFRTDADAVCPDCRKVHVDQHWRCDTLVLPCCKVTLRNSACKPYVLAWEDAPVLLELMKNPRADTAFVMMFEMQQEFHGYRWVNNGKQWYCFDGVLWRPRPGQAFTKELQTQASEALGTLVRYLGDKKVDMDLGQHRGANHEVQEAYKSLTQAYRYVQGTQGLSSILKTAAITKLFDETFAAKLDTDLDVAGAPNGVICLKTGRLLEGAHEQYVSKQVGAEYRGLDHPTPDIDAFFMDVFNGDFGVIAYLQRYIGYFLTGHTKLQSFAIFWGTGSNSKSVVADLLRLTFGEYFRNMARDCLFASDRRSSTNSATPHLAELDKVRLGVVEESGQTDVLDVAQVKLITGSSQINCRMLHQNNQVIDITHKPLLLTNFKPRIDVDDDAILRRLLVVPFFNVYKPAEELNSDNPHHRLRNPDLKDKLLQPDVLNQFLTWVVRGAVLWYAEGLGDKPALMRDAEQKYVGENDALGNYIQEACEVSPSHAVATTDFLQAYQMATSEHVSSKRLKTMMAHRGFKSTTQRIAGRLNATSVYRGLTFKG